MTEENTKAKSKLPLIIAAVVLVVALAGGGGWWYFQQQAKQVEVEVPENVPATALVKKPVFMPLTKFVVSIPGDDRLHYLMMEMSVMSYEQKQLDLTEEFLPLVRNTVITLLSDLHYNDLTQPGVIKPLQVALRDAVRAAMNDMAGSNGIDQVLITKMVIQ